MNTFDKLILLSCSFGMFSTAALADTGTPNPTTASAATTASGAQSTDTPSIPYGANIQALKSAGFSDADLASWKQFATTAYCQIQEVSHNDGSTGNETVCNIDTEQLIQWKSTGVGPEDASLWNSNGLSPTGAKLVESVFRKTCKNKLATDLGHQNPYSVKNKCFLITNYKTLQLISAHVALASPGVSLSELGGLGELAQAAGASDPKNVLVNYGTKKYAPAENAPVIVLVIGTGAWQYNSAEGTLETVAKVTVLVDLSQGD